MIMDFVTGTHRGSVVDGHAGRQGVGHNCVHFVIMNWSACLEALI